MATHDYVIANQSGAAFRTDLNNALAAIVTNNSNGSAPATTYAYQWWADTNANLLKLRNSANNAWITILKLDGTYLIADGSDSAPSLSFRDDSDTGIFSQGANQFNITCGGVERLNLGGTTVFNQTGADVDFIIEGDTDANLFYLDAGNDRIGIGTNTPVSKLNLHGPAGSAEEFTISEGGAVSGIKATRNSDTNSDLRFLTEISGTRAERLMIDYSGRILVGKTSSTDVFKVGNFQLKASSSEAASVIIESTETGNAGPNVILAHSRGGGAVGSGDILGDVSFVGHDGSDFESRGAIIRAKISAATGGNDMPTHLQFFTCQDGGANLTMGMQLNEDSTVLAAKSFVGKRTNDANVNTSTSSGFTADTFNVVLNHDVLEGSSGYLITFFWNHQGSGQPFESYGSFTFFPGSTNPGSAGAMGPNFVPLQGAHTEQGVSKFWTFRYYSGTGQHVHGLQAAFNSSLNDANGQGQLTVTAMKIADSTTI